MNNDSINWLLIIIWIIGDKESNPRENIVNDAFLSDKSGPVSGIIFTFIAGKTARFRTMAS